MVDEASIDERIWLVVARIPEGHVCTYGEVARLAGMAGAARRVGRALRALPTDSALPWHRVVAAGGRLALDAAGSSGREQRRRLRAEGITVSDRGRLDLARCRWPA